MGNWRGVATFLLFPALIMGVFTFAVIIPSSSQADSAELAILYMRLRLRPQSLPESFSIDMRIKSLT